MQGAQLATHSPELNGAVRRGFSQPLICMDSIALMHDDGAAVLIGMFTTAFGNVCLVPITERSGYVIDYLVLLQGAGQSAERVLGQRQPPHHTRSVR